MWIRFDVDGTLELTTDISLPDNITIDGREHDVQITGGGLRSSSVKIIITNLTFRDGAERDDQDALKVKGVTKSGFISVPFPITGMGCGPHQRHQRCDDFLEYFQRPRQGDADLSE